MLMATVALVGCTDNSDRGFPAAVRSNFLTNCNSASNGNVSYCECTLDALESEMGVVEFAALEQDYVRTGEMPGELLSAVSACQ